jgi:HlyD family secretion protein
MRRVARLVVALIVIALVVGAGAYAWNLSQQQPTAALTGSGTIEAVTVTLTAQLPARVEEVTAEESVDVAAGDVLVRFDATELEAQRAQAAAGVVAATAGVAATEAQLRAADGALAAAEAQSKAAQAQLEAAQANERIVTDRGSDDQIDAAEAQTAAAAARRDAANAGVTAARAQRDAAQAQVDARRAEVDAAKSGVDVVDVQIDALTITSPIDGVVLSRMVEPGEYAAPGAPVVVVGRLDRLTLTVYVPEDRYGQIQLGQRATVSVDSFPGESFDATVTRIADQAEFTPRNVQTAEGRRSTVFAVVLDVGDGKGRLKPGMPADVAF